SAGVIVLADPGTTKRERTTLAADLAELVARAEDALARRDLEEARGVAEQAAGVHPHDPTVHLLLGRIALASGRSVDAVEELRRALRLDPLAVAAHRVLGYALVGTGRFGEAVEQWDQWERLAARSEAELAQLEEVRRASPRTIPASPRRWPWPVAGRGGRRTPRPAPARGRPTRSRRRSRSPRRLNRSKRRAYSRGSKGRRKDSCCSMRRGECSAARSRTPGAAT